MIIKLYSKTNLKHSCRTYEQAQNELEQIKKENKLTDKNKFVSTITRNDKNIHLKFKWECSYYEHETLKEIEEDKKYAQLTCIECANLIKNSKTNKGCIQHRTEE